jgi:hypothetical protein
MLHFIILFIFRIALHTRQCQPREERELDPKRDINNRFEGLNLTLPFVVTKSFQHMNNFVLI